MTDDTTRKARKKESRQNTQHAPAGNNEKPMCSSTPSDSRHAEKTDLGALFQNLIDAIPYPIFFKGIDGVYIGCNKAFETYLGIQSDAIVSNTVYDLAPKELADIYHAKDCDLFDHPGTRTYEAQVKYADGNLHYVIFNETKFTDQFGTVKGIAGIIWDITESKEAEIARKESEAHYRTLVENINDTLFSADATGRITYISPAIERVSRYKVDEIVGQLFIQYIHPDDKLSHVDRFRRILEGETSPAEYRILDKDGSTIHVRSFSSPVYQEGIATGITGILTDITKQKQTERMLKLNEARLQSLYTISQADSMGIKELLDLALNEAVKLTGSAMGCFLRYDEDTQTLHLDSWSQEGKGACAITEKLSSFKLDKAGIWGEAVRKRKPLAINDYRVSNPFKKDYLEGHFEARRFLAVPVFSDSRITAVVGVANKETDYEDSDIRQLTVLMEGVWRIVEHRQAEEALRLSERKYRSLFESVSDLIYYHDLNGNFVSSECNFSLYDKWKSFMDEKLPAGNIKEVLLSRFKSQFEDYIGRIVKKGNDSGIFAVFDKDGNKHYFEYSNYLDQKDGIPIGVRGFARDVTEKIKTQKALEKSEEKFRTTLESIEDGYFEMDLSGHFSYVNPALCRIVKKPRVEMHNSTYHAFMESDTARSFHVTLEKISNTGSPEQGFFMELIRVDRTVVSTESSISLITDKDGVKTGFRGVMRDITERKRLERSLHEKNLVLQDMQHRMEKSNKELLKAYNDLKEAQSQIIQAEKMASIGQLAAGVAHEINNPMGFITSNLSTLGKYLDRITSYLADIDQMLARLPEDIAGEIQEKKKALKVDFLLDDIKSLISESLEGAERVKKIVLDLKSFSRQDEPELVIADINTCIESVLNIVWNEIKYKARVHKDLGDIPMLKCYARQLNQVFMNLLVNASNAIEKMGEITVKTAVENGWVLVSISDTGIGIPKKNIGKIFDPFFTTKDKGTGLGLSIAYDIVKRHNGEILVESKVGIGTKFTVRLPLIGEEL